MVTCFLLGSLRGFAGVSPYPPDTNSLRSGHQTLPSFFEMNMGQWAGEIRFTSRNPGMNLLFYERSVIYQLYKTDTSGANETAAPNSTHILNIGLHFRNPGPECTLRGSKPTGGYVNRLYGNDSSRWISNIPSYQEVQYSALYPGIDMKFFARKNHVKYDIVLHPGSNIRDLILEYSGIQKLATDADGQLLIYTDRGILRERIPETYQIVNGEKMVLDLKYYLPDSLSVGFMLPAQYDTSTDIIIDPTLIYSTYIGGSGDDNGVFCDLVTDNQGNVYSCGQSTATNFPVTAGAFDASNGGNYDCVVYKLNASGTGLIYATYIGGNDWDCANSIAIDTNTNEVYLIGSSQSSNFPVTAGAYQTTWGGGSTFDIVVFKLNSNGTSLVFSTYLGDQYNEQGHSIKIDSLGNIYCTGQAGFGFPVTPGAYQVTAGSGWDACFFKMNQTASVLLVSSLFGGSGDDRGGGIGFDKNLNIYLHGMTQGGVPITSGAFQTAYGGGTNDSFVAKFDPTGSTLLYSTFLGGNGNDYMRCQIIVDKVGFVYITGLCQSGFPVTPGAYDISYNGGTSDAYITKVNQSGSALVYSTYLGSPGADVGWRICINENYEVYATGLCGNGFPTTVCCYDNTFNGGTSDAYYVKLNATGSDLLYSTYIGGSGNELGNGIAERNDTAYICGYTSSLNFPTTPGSFDQTYNGGSNDLFVSKLATAPFTTALSADTTICSGSTIILSATGGSSYSWNTAQTTSSIYVSPTTTTTYSVTISNGSCSVVETVTVTVIGIISAVSNHPALCPGDSATITAAGTSDYLWSTGSTSASITVSPLTTTTYVVSGSLSGCTSSASVSISVYPQPIVDLGKDTVLCYTGPLVLDAGGGFVSYHWQDGSTDQTLAVSASGVYAVTISNTQACSNTDAIMVTMTYPPDLELGSGGILCNGSTVILDGGPGDGSWTYRWQDLSAGQYYPVSTPGTYMLTITNTCGEVSDSIVFAPCPACVADLPSAFSPNGDGVNDRFRVLGEGISDVSFLIYDRHGQKVFETTHPDEGWDGTFRGILQGNEVYYYYLSATCFNGETIVKKGDVTLIL